MVAGVRAPPAAARPAPAAGGALPGHVAALLRPETYPFPVGQPELRESHVSWVVLAGPYVYKAKKPVDLGFLDFTTLEARRAACRDEVLLNLTLCPDVYLGVAHIAERGGRYRLDGTVGGEPLVLMRRLPEEGMLPRMVAEHRADAALMRRLAARLAAFHARAPTGPGVDEHGGVATVRANWAENFAQTAAYVGRTIAAAQHRGIERFVDRFLARERGRLARRVACGRVRDGHGDLHAANVCVEGEAVHFFDCIEFAPRFRCADVAAEVAFLAMDLAHLGRADLADAFVRGYAAASGDAELPALLPFYLCYRAYVRGKVASFRLDQPGLSAAADEGVAAEARSYFDLAESFARPPRPALVALTGLPATGKTTLAAELARRLGFVHLSSDVVRKELAGLAPTVRQREAFGQGIYDPAMGRRTYALLRRRAGRWLRRGLSVILDATHGRRAELRAARALARRAGVRFVVLWCDADEAAIRARLAARAAAGGVSDARLEIWPSLRGAFDPPRRQAGLVRLDTRSPVAETVARALAALRDPRTGRAHKKRPGAGAASPAPGPTA